MKQRNIIIDCDPGIDDAVALCLAGANRDALAIHGIVTVSGNQVIDRVTRNACSLASFYGLDVPLAQGAKGPLLRQMISAGDIHGATGVGNCVLPETDKKVCNKPGILFLYDTIMNLPKEQKMTLIPTGPMTNIALLLTSFPDVKERIEEICFMGGAAVGGNVTPTAEFNIWADPEAAYMVLHSGLPLVMCGLDVTNHSGLTRAQVTELLQSERPVPRAVGEMLDFYFHTKVYEGCDSVAIHDAVTIMYLLHPELYIGREMRVTVDCSEGLNRGMTVCDIRSWGESSSQKGSEEKSGDEPWPLVKVLTETDGEAFGRLLMEAILSYA